MFSLPATWRQTSSKPISTRPARSRMIIFNIVRLSVYAAVFLFGLICLGMAGSFQHILAASDLTRFVPFALFVCSASLLGIFILVLFGLMKERNPISTRGELLSFAFLGLLWFVLGIYLTTSESQTADVECFASPSSTSPLDNESASFHTEQYQAMYRVLMVFALMNAIIVILTSSLMLFLAVRKHRNGDQHMWYGPITSCAWLQSYSKPGKNYRSDSQKSILPRSHSRGQSGGPSRSHSRGAAVMAEKAAAYTEKPTRERSGRSTHTRHGSGRRPSQSKTTPNYSTKIYDQHRRHGSGNGQGSIVAPHTNVDFENGAMVEPARAVNRDRHRN